MSNTQTNGEFNFGPNLSLQLNEERSGISVQKMTPEPTNIELTTFHAALDLVLHEVQRSYAKFPVQFASAHEGLSILQEEVHELTEQVYEQDVTPVAVLMEAIQCAAMSVRFLIDVCGVRTLINMSDSVDITYGMNRLVREGRIINPISQQANLMKPASNQEMRGWLVGIVEELRSFLQRASDRLTMDEGNVISRIMDDIQKTSGDWLCKGEGHLWVADGPNVKRCGRCGAWA